MTRLTSSSQKQYVFLITACSALLRIKKYFKQICKRKSNHTIYVH